MRRQQCLTQGPRKKAWRSAWRFWVHLGAPRWHRGASGVSREAQNNGRYLTAFHPLFSGLLSLPDTDRRRLTGESGIRTRGTGVNPYNGLANRRLQPLGHLSRLHIIYFVNIFYIGQSVRTQQPFFAEDGHKREV